MALGVRGVIMQFITSLGDMLDDWGIFIIVVIVLAVLAMLLRVLYRLWPAISRSVEIGNSLLKLPELQRDIRIIKHEIQHNDGSSIKDDVDIIKNTLESHTAILATNSAKLALIKSSADTAAVAASKAVSEAATARSSK